MNNLFSINGAADLLERDRATLVRALRHVPPDGFESGRPRWFMRSITTALDMSPKERRETGRYRDRFGFRHSKPLIGMRIAFEKRVAVMMAEPEPAQRRAMAIALAPLIDEYQRTFLDIGRTLGIADDDVLGARADLVTEEMLGEIAEAAGRGGDSGFFVEMVGAMAAHANDGEAA